MAVGIHELRALTPLGTPFEIQLGILVLQVSNLIARIRILHDPKIIM